MFQRWFVTSKDLQKMTPAKARDLIIKCFYAAQKETFANIKLQEKLPASEQEVKNTVTAAVKSVFTQIGEDFENPTKPGLLKVVEVLAANARSWGTPEDIIRHHKGQIQKVLNALKDDSRKSPTESERG